MGKFRSMRLNIGLRQKMVHIDIITTVKITKYDKDNNPVLLAGIVFDITEKKKLEEQLAEQNKLLYTLSFTDGLTKVKNHRALIKILEDTAIDANNNNETFSIALLFLFIHFLLKIDYYEFNSCNPMV